MQCYNVKTSIRNSSWSTRRKMGVWKTRCFEIECGGSPATEFGKAYEGRVEQSWWTKGMGFHGNAIFSFDVPSWPNRLKRIQFDMKYLDASIRSIPLGFVSLNWELPAVILNQVEGSEPVVRRVSSLLGVRTREAQVVGKIGLSTVQSDERGSGRLAAGCRLQAADDQSTVGNPMRSRPSELRTRGCLDWGANPNKSYRCPIIAAAMSMGL